jgi:transcriptional regulator with XRE-family HTH domain
MSQLVNAADAIRVEVRATSLAELRRARGLTQPELARRLGITPNNVPALESGSRLAGPQLRPRLADSLWVAFLHLFDVVLMTADGHEQTLRPAAPSPRYAGHGSGGPMADGPNRRL